MMGLGLGTPSSSLSIGAVLCYVSWGVLVSTVVLVIAIINGKLDAVLGIQVEKREQKGTMDGDWKVGDGKVAEWKGEKDCLLILP